MDLKILQSAKRRGADFKILKGVKGPVPDSAHTDPEDALPVSSAGVDKAGADAREGAQDAQAAGQKGVEQAKKGLNQGLDKVHAAPGTG